ncbi:amino acid adenylation domain-containing protein [candidate division KSB3 bacterium]|uniref:Amino acid adenylation domain-containing protein n=1 Tax=candidate division KSB3 bacterium TaxID=2044937 RepID=A0A9D5JWN4_9BACT|nr:amino acid adenylation domain-containing protein [candidate division KSB3 bacterium]MBD3325490.1 amino acid adenylation domain-containing protein [candidate division KSB3 bacterium]
MRTVEELLSYLRTLDVKVWIEADNLRLRAAKGRVSAELREELADRKDEILAFLRTVQQEAAEASDTIPHIPRTGNLPLSFAQQRLWFISQLEEDSAAYNIPLALHIRGQLNLAALRQSFEEIVRRHEVFRTTFVLDNEQPRQVIAPTGSIRLPLVDLQALPEPAQMETVRALAREDAQRPFTLEQGHLLRLTVLRLSPDHHVLLCTMHHIISDGWSTGILIREMSALYTAFSQGMPSPLPALPIQYADFAAWQRNWLSGERLNAQLDYWKRHLTGAPALLELPTDHPRGAVQTFRGHTTHFDLPSELTNKLNALSQQAGTSLFMTLLAAFAVLLARYTRQDDLVIGTPTANRQRQETEPLIGFFVNTLALRLDLSGNPPFRELLQQVRQVALNAYQHQDLPFERLIDALQLERNLSYTPLFQVMFALQNTPLETLHLPGLSMDPLKVANDTAKFDLSLYLEETEQGLTGGLEYNTDLFDADRMHRLQRHFQMLLEGITANPDTRILDLPLLTESERRCLLIDWNATSQEYPDESCFHELFEAQAARTPDAIAVEYEDRCLTYRELNAQANHVAHYLRKAGVGPEVLVGIYLERSLAMLVGLLGILKAGGAYVPLDPAFPKDRLAYMIEDARLGVLLTQESLHDSVDPASAHVIRIDSDWEQIALESQENPAPLAEPANAAYVIYTSGSTGKPKGVQICHRPLVNFLASMQQQPGLRSEDTLLAVTTISFDIAALELYLPLMIGAKVIIASRELAADGAQLIETLTDAGVTVMQATPATWRLMLAAGWQGHSRLKILCGGEALPRQLAADLVQRGTSVWNLYGPTETTIWSAVSQVEAQSADSADDTPECIGSPLANTQFYILDSRFQPVPVGIPGELYIGGAGLARGYFNRPDLTADRFIPNPFNQDPENGFTRLYRTGDLVRYRAEGYIEFLGRIDHQVKIRGFRIELGEIESVLAQHPDIRETVVIARTDRADRKQLVAYLVPVQGQKPASEDLRRFLSEHLPEYMIPAVFVSLEAMPLTPNGKVNRLALPAPEKSHVTQHKAYVAPRSEVEHALAAIWAEVLGIDPIGVHDNFFALGGDSILSMQIITRAKSRGIHFTPRQIFQYQTIAELARVAETRVVPDDAASTPPGQAPRTPDQQDYTPTDFPGANVSQKSLDKLLKKFK